MSIARASIIRGPGAVKLGSVQMFDRESISADLGVDTFDVPVSAYGIVDSRRKDVNAKISFRPCGELTANILAALFPHGTPTIGASLFGATDTACEVHSVAGQKITFKSAALTKMPNLRLSTQETAFSSQAEITAVRANNTDPATDSTFYTAAAVAFAGAFDVANIKGGVYTGTWNSITFNTVNGWNVEFDMQTTPQYVDGIGTVDMMLSNVIARASCIPVDKAESDILGYLALQNTGAAMGGTMRSGHDLVIACSNALTVTLKEVSVVKGPLNWGETALRAGELGFVAHRTIVNGVPGALFSVALTA